MALKASRLFPVFHLCTLHILCVFRRFFEVLHLCVCLIRQCFVPCLTLQAVDKAIPFSEPLEALQIVWVVPAPLNPLNQRSHVASHTHTSRTSNVFLWPLLWNASVVYWLENHDCISVNVHVLSRSYFDAFTSWKCSNQWPNNFIMFLLNPRWEIQMS